MIINFQQREICKKYEVKEVAPEEMVAVAIRSIGKMPIFGCRTVLSENNNISWFFHGGEHSDDENFYSTMHCCHLKELFPHVIPYLYLPPKTRFIIDDLGYEDVWSDD